MLLSSKNARQVPNIFATKKQITKTQLNSNDFKVIYRELLTLSLHYSIDYYKNQYFYNKTISFSHTIVIFTTMAW